MSSPQDPDLVAHEIAAVVREQLGHLVDRRVLAMNGAESVIHVGAALVLATGQQSQAAGETLTLRFVLARLLGVEAHVLQQQQVTVVQIAGQQPGALPDGVQREVHRPTEQRRQPVSDRAE